MDASMESMLADMAEREGARVNLMLAQVYENEDGRPEYNPDAATRRLEWIGATIVRVVEACCVGDADAVISLARQFSVDDADALRRLANAPEARHAFAPDKVKVGTKYEKPKQIGTAKKRNVRESEQDAERYRAQIQHIMRAANVDEKEADRRWLDEAMKREHPDLRNPKSVESNRARKALRAKRDRWKHKG